MVTCSSSTVQVPPLILPANLQAGCISQAHARTTMPDYQARDRDKGNSTIKGGGPKRKMSCKRLVKQAFSAHHSAKGRAESGAWHAQAMQP